MPRPQNHSRQNARQGAPAVLTRRATRLLPLLQERSLESNLPADVSTSYQSKQAEGFATKNDYPTTYKHRAR